VQTLKQSLAPILLSKAEEYDLMLVDSCKVGRPPKGKADGSKLSKKKGGKK
jgi:hypothetical protein